MNGTSSKFKTFVLQRQCQENEKTTHQMGKIFPNHMSDKGLVSGTLPLARNGNNMGKYKDF